MSQEYRVVSGYGVKITKDVLELLNLNNDYEIEDLFEDSNYVSCEDYGDSWSGENLGYSLLIKDQSFNRLSENIVLFVQELLSKNIHISLSEVEMISELEVY